MAETEIRMLSPDDASAYYALRVASEKEYPEYVGFSAERELMAGEVGVADLIEGYASEGTQIFSAWLDGVCLGVAAVTRRLSAKYQHRGFVWGMYVLPSQRNTGLAHDLLETAIAWAQTHEEVNILWLQVTTTNLPAIRFYEKHGFTQYGMERASLFAEGKYHDVFFMDLATGE